MFAQHPHPALRVKKHSPKKCSLHIELRLDVWFYAKGDFYSQHNRNLHHWLRGLGDEAICDRTLRRRQLNAHSPVC